MSLLTLLPFLLTAGGAWLLCRLRFFFLLHPHRACRVLRSAFNGEEKNSSFSTLMLALAGTLGVGNITGVAIGILIGGAGSVLWLLFSALFAAVLKYAEATVTASGAYRDGMIGVIRRSFPHGKALSALYALLCLGLCYAMGGALQCRTVTRAAEEMFSLPDAVGTFLFLLFILLCIFGGTERIMKKTAILIPIATVLYMMLCIIAIIKGMDRLPAVLSLILSSALRAEGVIGGAFGFLTSRALREGFCRGLLSNEAGAGTSTLAHAGNGGVTPAAEGVLGMCEVFFDTVLLCMLTALALLVGAGEPSDFSDAFSYLSAAFSSSFGVGYKLPLFLCFFIFAASTSLCWFYYGNIAWDALLGTKKKRRTLFAFFFLAFIGVGGVSDELLLVRLCDRLLFFAGVLTLATLFRETETVRRETLSAGLMTERGGRRAGRDPQASR